MKNRILLGLVAATALVPVAASASQRTESGAQIEMQNGDPRTRPEFDRRERQMDRRIDRTERRRDAGEWQRDRNRPNPAPADIRDRGTPRPDQREWQREETRPDNRDGRWSVTNADRNRWEGRERGPDDRRDRDRYRPDERRDAGRYWSNDSRDRRYDWRNVSRDHDRWDNRWRHNDRYDWRNYRSRNRHVYHLPRYYAPRGWEYGYRRFSIGVSLGPTLYGRTYWIGDPGYYRLPPVYGPYRWVRYYNDALLVDVRSGIVVDTVYDIFW